MARTYRYISGDSHLEVPCDWWTPRVPGKYRARAPRRIRLPNGGDGFIGEGSPLIFGGTGHFAGKTPEAFDPMVAVDFDEAAGSGTPEQRLREQDADGIDGELLFPSSTATKVYRNIRDDDAYLAVIRAYNDYLAEEYCSYAPDRLIGVGVLPHRGVDGDIAEMERCAKIGLKTVVLGRYPGGENYPTPEHDRFWAAAIQVGMPLCIHTSLSHGRGPLFKYPTEPAGERPDDDYINRLYRLGHSHCGALDACQMVIAGVFDRFPELKIYWAENQIGWLPFYYEQMDLEYEKNHHWAERLFGLEPLKSRPSEYLKEHAYWGFFDDPVGVRLRYEVGVDHIVWGSDFPHIVTRWPHSLEVMEEQMAGVPEDEKRKMMAQNLIDFLHLEGSGVEA